MLNSIGNSNINDALDQYNKIKYPTQNTDKIENETTEETDDNTEIEDSEDAIDKIIDQESDSDDNSYNLTFDQQTMIQQQMQMESMITQFNLANKASESGTTYTASLDYSILQGKQVADQIGVINANVSATTNDKNNYINDRFISNDSDDTNETDNTTEDNSIDNSENIKHIDLHL